MRFRCASFWCWAQPWSAQPWFRRWQLLKQRSAIRWLRHWHMNKPPLVCALALLAMNPCPARAEDARQIMREVQYRTQSKSEHYEGSLQVFNASQKISRKRWEYDRLGAYGNSKSELRFAAPAEVKGVALLVINHPDRASDQWMWIPAQERDRRIALQDRSTRFFGTDFSFEDLEERDTNQFDYKLLGEESIDGAPCWKVQSTPKESKVSQYTHSYLWIRKDNYAFSQIANSNKNQLVRRAHYTDIRNDQAIWTAHQ